MPQDSKKVEITGISELHPVTIDWIKQIIEMDWLVRQELGRQIQVTVRSQDGKAQKDSWFSVH